VREVCQTVTGCGNSRIDAGFHVRDRDFRTGTHVLDDHKSRAPKLRRTAMIVAVAAVNRE